MECRYVNEGGYWLGTFEAMASPCEVLVDCDDETLAHELCQVAADETKRIEQKYSRYRSDSTLSKINRSHGRAVIVDNETAQLLDYAQQCWQLSDGRFDVTSGVLREAWHFDGSDRLPAADTVKQLLQRIGWQKLLWRKPELIVPEGMELDFGGIGKEYAVDRSALLCKAHSSVSVLINYGGDLYASAPRRGDQPWLVAIEDPRKGEDSGVTSLRLYHGAIATSGDARRYLLKDGVRYGHILDPRNGWPVRAAPRSVTVSAESCVEAGMLATFAMLQGSDAERFLAEQQVDHWCVW